MAITSTIKQNKKNPLTIEDIIDLSGLSFGAMNEKYVLEKNTIGKFTMLYDSKKIGRGLEIFLDDKNNININILCPSPKHEIDLYFDLIAKICEKVDTTKFKFNDMSAKLKKIDDYKNFLIKAYQESLRWIKDQIENEECKTYSLFCALNPICLDKELTDKVGDNLDELEKLLDNLQKKKSEYVIPRFYTRNNDKTALALYYIPENTNVTVPLKEEDPFIENKFYDIEVKVDYYAEFSDENFIDYSDFINNVKFVDNYDAQRKIVCLSEQDVKELIDKYAVNILTNRKDSKAKYYGAIIDSGYSHSEKVKEKKLDTDEINGFSHMAIYLRWMYENKLVSKETLEACDLKKDIKDLRSVIENNPIFSGFLRSYHFNKKGKEFTNEVYSSGKKSYLSEVDRYAGKYFKKENQDRFQDEAYLFLPFDEDYYKHMKEFLDETYLKFKENNK